MPEYYVGQGRLTRVPRSFLDACGRAEMRLPSFHRQQGAFVWIDLHDPTLPALIEAARAATTSRTARTFLAALLPPYEAWIETEARVTLDPKPIR